MSSWSKKDRGTSEYDKPCRGCRVLDVMPCPMAEEAYNKGVELKRCEVLKTFGESIIEALTSKYGKRTA
jgi:hypothetical protein